MYQTRPLDRTSAKAQGMKLMDLHLPYLYQNSAHLHRRNLHSHSHCHRDRVCLAQSSTGQTDAEPEEAAGSMDRAPPSENNFQRRVLVGVGSASVVALGANFARITSFLLGLWPESGRSLKLDVLYPIGGYSRCIQPDEGFEFMYPETWVGDQTLLYRAAGKAEQERSLSPPPLNSLKSPNEPRRTSINEPVVAFGPPGSSGEINVSVIVSQVPIDFTIEEAFGGGPKDVGEAIIRSIGGRGRGSDTKGMLLRATTRQDPSPMKVNYYELEFQVQSTSFQRHNVAVCCTKGDRLYTLNAQAPESAWTDMKRDFYIIANSFKLTS